MKTWGSDTDPRLSFYCKDPESKTATDCATFYRTDRRSWVIQGQALGPGIASQLQGLRDDETYLEIPEALVQRFVHLYVEEMYGTDLTSAAERTDRRHSRSAETGVA